MDWSVKLEDVVAWLLDVPGKAVLIIAIAVVLRWLAHRFINRLTGRAAKGAVPEILANSKAGVFLSDLRNGTAERRRQRAETMGSLLRSIASGAIWSIAFVMVLGVFGLPIAPLLTGAGVAGVALGFGAQTLVKDFLSGIFMILEDQYGVGDAVDLGEASGMVESVGLRVTKLRDVNGTAWYVRNGEILRVGNQSQEWARTVLDVTVAYDSDLDQVQQILREEAHALYTDSTLSSFMIEEPEVWGVERFDKDGVVVRTVAKTAPLHQGEVGRALRSRVLRRFDAAGIRIPSTTFPPSGGTA
ncbi:mechanosensitive ion channel [Aeromicrobium sp. 636]|uniref:Mechanosensitive ion channel family protein n=1 Tax=Aeromicrobium senzhongii TaxID=2663859 RepID=A0A8I0EW69_9ACTN|nr:MULTISPECIES: mechanosensitive ion channel family protein [Aeromicrobium]MBC9226307.1 mechanosensitive ion channel family protein [Aeromicrobium senzhongii]MCQ3998413.1 mechanosensitive ion channel [Aeromicrobium sp. 636]MTB88842.1 mechanosensitive ion channel [Aeromicrobium senzhongii]QNL93870.1 mechanosensitive ion channel family protein [Aeromicrobium senzhongii]